MGMSMLKKGKVQRIGLLSAAKTGFAVSAFFGLIIGAVWAIVMALFSAVAGSVLDMPAAAGVAVTLLFPLFFTLFYAGAGTAGALLFALIYNIAAGLIGGIELEVDIEERSDASPSSGLHYPPDDFYNEYR